MFIDRQTFLTTSLNSDDSLVPVASSYHHDVDAYDIQLVSSSLKPYKFSSVSIRTNSSRLEFIQFHMVAKLTAIIKTYTHLE
jgi:hypothetical protein